MKKCQMSKGFTLIELLTVIAIIGILTALLTVSFIGVRQRGRDAQRKSNIKQMQSSFELYRADTDSYPASATFSTCGSAFTSGASAIIYMQKIPCDPTSNGPYYYYQSTATSYIIASCIENKNDRDAILGDAAHKPSYWPVAAAWPPTTTCASGYYYVAQNP